MTDDQILNTILKNTYTKSSFFKRMNILRRYLEHYFFKEKIPLEKFLANLNLPPQDKEALLSWNKDLYSSFTLYTLYKQLDHISKAIKTIPNITLYIPIDTTPEDREKLGSWVKENISIRSLLDLRHDPKRIGGAAVVYNNIYRDFSLHHFMTKNKNEIMGILDDYQIKTAP